ncbi:MAG: hypothetical protein J0L92_21625 [Deltaproteobacteria bacterium]|nr:hypothetical protein [Deltaproteobacteria bacterium]
MNLGAVLLEGLGCEVEVSDDLHVALAVHTSISHVPNDVARERVDLGSTRGRKPDCLEDGSLRRTVLTDEHGPHAGLALVGEVERKVAEALEVLRVQAADVHAPSLPAPTPAWGTEYASAATPPWTVASRYPELLAGTPTPSVEPYDPGRHARREPNPSLPFGTVLRVTREETNTSVIVLVNDRGPFGDRSRVLDLSRSAAEALDMIRAAASGVSVTPS